MSHGNSVILSRCTSFLKSNTISLTLIINSLVGSPISRINSFCFIRLLVSSSSLPTGQGNRKNNNLINYRTSELLIILKYILRWVKFFSWYFFIYLIAVISPTAICCLSLYITPCAIPIFTTRWWISVSCTATGFSSFNLVGKGNQNGNQENK